LKPLESRESAIVAIEENRCSLDSLPEEFQGDKEVVLAAVLKNPHSLFYASDDLKNDKEVVLAAIRQSGAVLSYASDELKNNQEVVLAAVLQNGLALEFASASLKDNEEIVYAALSQNGAALDNASDRLKDSEEIVRFAIAQDDLFIQYASDRLKDDEKFILSSFRFERLNAIMHLSPRLQEDILNGTDSSFLRSLYLLKPSDINDLFTHLNMGFAEQIQIKNHAIASFIESKLQEHIESGLPIDLELLSTLKRKIPELISSYRSHSLQAFLVHALSLHFSSAEGTEQFLALLLSKKPISFHQGRILPLIALKTLNFSKDVEHLLMEKIFRCKSLKGGIHLQIFLNFLCSLSKSTLDQETKFNSIESVFKEKATEDQFFLMQLIESTCAIDQTILLEKPLNREILTDRLIQKLESFELIEKGILDVKKKFLETFLHRKFRDPAAIFSYVSLHYTNPVMKEFIKQFITSVFEESFIELRNARNSHLDFLKEDQRHAWETALCPNIPFLHDFLIEKLVDEARGDGIVRKELFELDSRVETVHGGAGAPRSFSPNEIEGLILSLKNTKSIQEALAILEELHEMIPSGVRFKEDIDTLKTRLVDSIPVTIEETEAPQDLLLIGTEVERSCLRICGDPRKNCCVMGVCLDGKMRALVLRDESGRIKTRALIKILLNSEDQPVLFIDDIYPAKTPEIEEIFIQFARKKAESMGLDLYREDRSGVVLHSINRFSFPEYEDAERIGVTNGEYSFNAIKIE
jgi:hypothetical protein